MSAVATRAKGKKARAHRVARKPEPEVWLARIHPRNPQQGYHAKTILFPGSGYPKFEEGKGWYEVDREMARKLRTLRNNDQDPHSRPVFQVVRPEVAEALDEAEREVVAEASSPIRMPSSARRKSEETDDTLEGWDDDEDEVPEALGDEDDYEESRKPRGPIETADEEDIDEVEALADAAEAAADLTTEDLRSGTRPAKKATSGNARRKPASAKLRKKASKKRPAGKRG